MNFAFPRITRRGRYLFCARLTTSSRDGAGADSLALSPVRWDFVWNVTQASVNLGFEFLDVSLVTVLFTPRPPHLSLSQRPPPPPPIFMMYTISQITTLLLSLVSPVTYSSVRSTETDRCRARRIS
ncbi:hypothetical protein B0H10DRAFT_589432 [Mycena sp. CBHHK59/15]|nr:hypothetical protein B0H10DRAFT_589432 [Mycena sp. CBHHK59/15]